VVNDSADVVQAAPDGVVVAVWVVPHSSRNEITGLHGGALRVRVAAPPERGRANAAAASLVAGFFGGQSGEVLSGEASRRKRILVAGVGVTEARLALEGLSGR